MGPADSGTRSPSQNEHGVLKTVEIALLHRRLSIIDHADGAQPMVSERGRTEDEGLVAVVFNGCIYNHRELRAKLEAAGHVFATDHSDTEVLIHGHREWGRKLTDHLEGMYAFAVWDRTSATLYLARDWFGEKPLYTALSCMHEQSECGSPGCTRPVAMAFSSEAHALTSLNIVNPHATVDDSSIQADEYLQNGYINLFESPSWCVANHCPGLINANCELETTNWAKRKGLWFKRRGRINWGDQPCRIIDELLDRAVARRLEADVPLGCFLSGGVDSSLIAHFAKKHTPDLRTFSVMMPDARYDESQHAERVAEHLGTDHTTLQCAMNPAEDLVHLINILGQPFGDSSILPTYWVSKAAREHVTVALSGDGGDELFIGYERYMAARMLARYHRLLKFLPSRRLKRFHPKSKLHKLGRLGEMARDYPFDDVAAMTSLFHRDAIAELISLPAPLEGGGRGAGGEGEHRHHGHDRHSYMAPDPPSPGSLREPASPRGRGDRDALARLREFDIISYLPNDLLRKVDTASMACALEVRCPFLDRDLASAALSMPIDWHIPRGQRKWLLRNIARKYLPKDIVDRPKMGFAIPIGEWLRTDFGGMKTLLLDHLNSADPFGPVVLNPAAVRRYVDEHMAGTYDHGQKLFSLLTLSIWGRSVFEGMKNRKAKTLTPSPSPRGRGE
jgi:asparagine synthase (glutamine-hydrolysing)